MMKKHRLDKESHELWLDVCDDKRELSSRISPNWKIILQSSLFVNGEFGILFDSDNAQWLVRATLDEGERIRTRIESGIETVDDILKAIP